jgi:hypothetical protein
MNPALPIQRPAGEAGAASGDRGHHPGGAVEPGIMEPGITWYDILGVLPGAGATGAAPSRTSAGCSTTWAWRWRPGVAFTSGPSGSPSARWRSTGWWSIRIPGRRPRRIGAARSRCSSGTRPPGHAGKFGAVITGSGEPTGGARTGVLGIGMRPFGS